MWGLEHHKLLPVYHIERCGGTDHAPHFTSTVSVGEQQATADGAHLVAMPKPMLLRYSSINWHCTKTVALN